jgi:hypothetical protein
MDDKRIYLKPSMSLQWFANRFATLIVPLNETYLEPGTGLREKDGRWVNGLFSVLFYLKLPRQETHELRLVLAATPNWRSLIY